MNWRVPLTDLDYGGEEKQAVLDVLESRWLNMGKVTHKFEEKFAQFVGAKYAVAVSNATMALHLALLSLDIGPGDEVIVPSFSFVATANAILYTGARVRFVDISGPEDLNISPESIEVHITPWTKAIVVMHYGGYACRMDEIKTIAECNHLDVVENAAHATGAVYKGKGLGTWGDAGYFSFFANKNMGTGEGSMLVTDREDVYAKARVLRSYGMASDGHHGNPYDVVDLGFDYKLDEIRAALGLVQLGKFEHNNTRRWEITTRYHDAFSHTSLVIPFHELPMFTRSTHHIYPVLLPVGVNRRLFIDRLREAGVQTSIHYPPIHQLTYYQKHYPEVHLPYTEDVASREVTLPLFPNMTDGQVDWVINCVREALLVAIEDSHSEISFPARKPSESPAK